MKGLRLNLTEEIPAPLLFHGVDASGEKFEIRWEFKRRLNRQQITMMFKTVGKGRKKKEVPDLERLYGTCIASIGPIDLQDGQGFRTVSDIPTINRIMNNIDEEIAGQVDEHILQSNQLDEVEKKESSGPQSPTTSPPTTVDEDVTGAPS